MKHKSTLLLDTSDMNVPIVSIIVVCYNHEAFIDECLQSCVAQADTFDSIEIVVADDGSSDTTPKKIQEWASRYPSLVRPVLAESNTGIASNFNRGLSAAKGENIAWLGGDDVMLVDKIRHQVECLGQNPHASGCYHDAEVFAWPSGETLGLFSRLYAGKAGHADQIDARRMLDPRYQMLPSTIMVRRRCLPTAFDVRLRFHNDYLFDFETIANGGPYVRMVGVYTRYRKHEKSIGLDQVTRATMLEENLMVLAIIEARYPAFVACINKRTIYYFTLEVLRRLRDGDRQYAMGGCRAIWSRGGRFRSIILVIFGSLLTRLVDPKYRLLAVKLRSILA